MADVDISPNMGLPVPQVNREIGPDWATDYNACMQTLDQHDHASGSGVPISQDGINLTPSPLTFDSLDFQGSNAFDLRTVKFIPQVTTPALPTDVGCLTEVGVDLYYIDGAGNPIRLTQGGSIVGTAGSITGLPSGTASASYAGGTFTWESATNTAANMDAGSYLFRNASAGSFALTLNPPNAMAADFDIFLPSVPGTKSIMTLDSAGNMAGDYTTDNSTVGINGSNEFYVVNGGIGALQIGTTAVTDTPVNIGVLPSVAANALTLTITDSGGSTPSATSPVRIPYRNSTAGVGQPTVVTTTGTLAITVAQLSTLGCPSGVSTYIYLYTINNAGANEAAVSHALYDDGTIVTTVNQIAGADTSPYLMYSAVGRTNVACKLIARIKVTQTGGNWAVPTEVALITPNTRPGPVLATYYGAAMATSSASPAILNFATKVADTTGAVTTGASWKFTAPETGVYALSTNLITVPIFGTPGDRFAAYVYVNGTSYLSPNFIPVASGFVFTTAQCPVVMSGSIQIPLNQGDYIDIRGSNSIGTINTSSTAGDNNISIARVR
jgi:hypothetical protein